MDIAAQIAIRDLIARYSDAVWRQDMDRYGACWARDGEWRMLGAVMTGRDMIVAGSRESMRDFASAWQTAHNIVIESEATTARGRLFVEEWITARDGSTLLSRGIYHDDYVVEDDAWRFARRHYDLVYFGPPDFSGRSFATAAYGRPPDDSDPGRPATPSQAEFLRA